MGNSESAKCTPSSSDKQRELTSFVEGSVILAVVAAVLYWLGYLHSLIYYYALGLPSGISSTTNLNLQTTMLLGAVTAIWPPIMVSTYLLSKFSAVAKRPFLLAAVGNSPFLFVAAFCFKLARRGGLPNVPPVSYFISASFAVLVYALLVATKKQYTTPFLCRSDPRQKRAISLLFTLFVLIAQAAFIAVCLGDATRKGLSRQFQPVQITHNDGSMISFAEGEVLEGHLHGWVRTLKIDPKSGQLTAIYRNAESIRRMDILPISRENNSEQISTDSSMMEEKAK